ncbi:ABC transporter ATP-binding protein [Pyrobaculum ferrireducens]|uniref:ABC transporter ATP-binding protein n=1 Tax=Pyrobaculum ferrireducens TaxID=1104324 RepID=G7VI99_9CREN|nr:ABC transporter ATP-binding protein [Pyrobaculum ferrireducens]AET32191.1 ABC transporter ATP-binding protein [Pyrobaculum ferrireducens]
MDKAVIARGLTKHYGSFTALDSLSLEIARGETWLLFGPMGSGKTTFFKCVLGLARCAGYVEVMGRRDPAAIREVVGYSPQDLGFEPGWRVRRVVEYFAELRGVRVDVLKVLEGIGLSEKAEARVEELSGGMRRMLSIALAFLGEPEVLFFDEPLNDLDVKARAAFIDTIKEVRGEGKTVVISSHDYEPFLKAIDKVAVLKNGRLVAVLENPEDIVKYV